MSKQMMVFLGVAIVTGVSALYYKLRRSTVEDAAVIVGPPSPPPPGDEAHVPGVELRRGAVSIPNTRGVSVGGQ